MAKYAAGIKTKEKIIEASKELFFKKGYLDTTCSDICKEVGIRLGNLSYHFSNKIKIAEHIYNAIMNYYQQRIVTLFPEEDEMVLLITSVFVHHKMLFEDDNYRRFSSQYTRESMRDISLEDYKKSALPAYSQMEKMLGQEKADFFFNSFAGVDIRIETYIDENIEKLTYEKTARYTIELYYWFFDKVELNSKIDKALELVKKLDIKNDQFNITLELKENNSMS